MKEFKGTPGPWFLGGVENEKQSVNASAYFIALVDEGACRNANARLIAAAPELLSALQEALIDMRIAQGNMRDAAKTDKRWEGCAEAFQSRVDAADLAIAKALGESQ